MKHSTNTWRGLRIGMVVIAILGAALLLCSTLVTGVGAGIAMAQEQEYQQQSSAEYREGERDAQGEAELQPEPAMDDNDDDVPVRVVYRGYGFALNADGTGTGTEFHALPLRVNIIRVRQLEPIRIRELMGQNRSIDEIRGEIMEKACAPTYQGYMQFAETHYKLVNINVNVSHVKAMAVNNLAIDADIIMAPVSTPIPMHIPMQDTVEAELEPTGNGNENGNGNASAENPYQEQDQSAGNISLNVLNLGHENFITIGEGKLTIRERGEAFQFQYHVLLRSER